MILIKLGQSHAPHQLFPEREIYFRHSFKVGNTIKPFGLSP